jgi:CRISPR/Cas system-associated endonuclease/helicase Cas3
MNAISLADRFKHRNPDWTVYHLSSYFVPGDRERILAQVTEDLRVGEKKILLVATSVVECGVDFSFELGFREKGSLPSILQFGGRVNRNCENAGVKAYEFMFDSKFLYQNPSYTMNPSILIDGRARGMMAVDSDNCTEAIKNYIEEKRDSDLIDVERAMAFNTMNKEFAVIPNLTETVIINPQIIERVKKGEMVPSSEISRNSVSIFRNKLDPTKANSWAHLVDRHEDMYYWTGPYDPEFYGVFAHLF